MDLLLNRPTENRSALSGLKDVRFWILLGAWLVMGGVFAYLSNAFAASLL
jgi:hypothetical protein